MMDRKQIITITNKHYRKLKKNLDSIVPECDPEAIHQFRVEYKKLRALLRMVSCQPGRNIGIAPSGKLKKAYNISGSIRDLQLQQQRLAEAVKKEARKPQAYLSLLQKEIEKLKPELAEIISEKPVQECRKKTDRSVPAAFQLSDFHQFAVQKWIAIQAILLTKDFSDENIHVIRKILKDLFYDMEIYSHAVREALRMRVWKGKDETWFTELLDELGHFQDECRSIALLKSYWIASLNNYNQELLNRLKKAWINDKIKSKQVLIKKIKMGLGATVR